MAKVVIGLNAEYSRSSDKPFEWAVEHAAKIGYKYYEPMVHYGRELMRPATSTPSPCLTTHSELRTPATPPA